MKSNRGYSLIEVLIGMAVLLIAFTLVSSVIVTTINQSNRASNRVNIRVLSSRLVSQFVTESSHFHPVMQGSSVGTYIFCFDRRGVPKPFNGSEESLAIVFLTEPKANIPTCSLNSMFNIQISHDKTDSNKAFIDIFEIQNGKLNKVLHEDFIQTHHY